MDSPKLHFMDNVDPASFDALFHAINLRQTGFLVISKSGGTAETMMQFLVCLESLLKAVGPERVGAQMTAVAEPGARSEEHTSELQSLMRISYAVFCLKKKKTHIARKTDSVTKEY